MDEARRRGRQVLLIIAALFFVPVLLAFAMYYGNFGRPTGSVSLGELVSPAQPLDAAGLRHADGSPVDPALLHDKWTLIYIGDGACDDACRAALVLGRQTRLALNNDMTRVQRAFLATGHCCANEYFAAEQPGLIALDASSAPRLVAVVEMAPG